MPTTTVNIPNTTFVSSAQPDNTLYFYPTMRIGTDPDPQFASCAGLMQIELPALPVYQVDTAKLKLSVIEKSGAAPSPVVVQRVTEPFNVQEVTYNTAPAYVTTEDQAEVTTADLYTAIEIDITDLVNSWLNGSEVNNGIALINPDGTTVVQLATNNIVYEPYFPTLELTYSASPQDGTAICFSYAQLAHVINQLITLYPGATMTVYTRGSAAVSLQGNAVELYVSPDATYGTLFILNDAGETGAVPLNAISAIKVGDTAVYDPAITYLPAPEFPTGCDTNLITAYHDYLSVGDNVTVYPGVDIMTSGRVYKNEYGLLVLTTDEIGTKPIFIPVFSITAFTLTETTGGEAGDQQSLLTSSREKITI
jgi:hypothetical protein